MKDIRALAIYLPQFHPIRENDEWWGKGFTEWTNVSKTTPRFKGHYQPHLPSDLGFYDLRLDEVRNEQAILAKEYGIEGFCYYHYWFNGRRVLETPMNKLLKSNETDFPFCVCWANENWTRRWDGQDKEILLEQNYTFDDDREHIRYLCEHVFSDKRYIRVDNKPVFIIYRPNLFPDIRRTTEIWREEALKNGTGELYLMYMQCFDQYVDPKEWGFDAAVEFQPDFTNFSPAKNDSLLGKIRTGSFDDRVFDYGEITESMLNKPAVNYKRFPGVFPMWDNSARRKKNAYIIHNSSPEKYEYWLRKTVEKFIPYSPEENFIFLNAWNEWAEGNHLEPCQKWGRKYLEATKRALKK